MSTAGRCLVCSRPTESWLEKTFPEPDIGRAFYDRCPNCGFVTARTVTELPPEAWQRVNKSFHDRYQGSDSDPNDPKWRERLEAQADVIADLENASLIPSRLPWVDYGCGDGKLSSLVARRSPVPLLNYDPYMTRPGYLTRSELAPKAFSFVISTSVFEHLRTRAHMDEITSFVADDGVMGLHTMVAEEVPADPSWFYFLPVHCSFFTNASMQCLFDAWGYRSSIYHVGSRLWFFFKADPVMVERTIARLNLRAGPHPGIYHFKRGFMDYWKLKPSEVLERRSLTGDHPQP